MQEKFQVLLSEEVRAFLRLLSEKDREKILYNIRKAQLVHDDELFKKLTDEIREFRTLFNRTHYRIFAFWDEAGPSATLVLTTHGIVKKTGKTPPADLARAEQIRRRYFDQKTRP